MATAYAAFTSLMHLISDLHEHLYPPIKLDEEQFDTLNSRISFFQRFLEDHHTALENGLKIRIADAAYAAEDVIEAHIADEVFDQEDFDGSLQKVIEGMDHIEKEVMEMNWNTEKSHQPRPPLASSSQPLSATSGENIVVGLEGKTIIIVGKLTQPSSGRRIISITGMGGIGKTTLACKVYDHKYIKDYYDIRTWATISKDYNTHESLIELVHCIDKIGSKESLSKLSEYELGERLYKSLIGRRYLVIVDDVWDVEAWDRLRSFFPASNGSGIVITTRESRVASIGSDIVAMDLLDESESWNLFCKIVFGQDSCRRELEDIGKKIAENCRGLPLSVVVIGGHLSKSPSTQEYWESTAKNLSSIVNSEDNDHCLRILSLSYIHLPVHLKPCFLYMGIFPEDEEIDVSELIRLWVAEGFLKPIHGKNLEDAGEDYVNDLISRNLIVSRRSPTGKLIGCKIHDLLRDLSIKEALKEEFLCIQWKDVLQISNNERRIAVYPNAYEVDRYYSEAIVLKSLSIVRTLILHYKLPSVMFKSLRVLASRYLNISLNNMLEVTHQLVNLRYLGFSSSKVVVSFPSSIFSIWNLQSLDISDVEAKKFKIPEEIWKMSQLRYIRVSYSFSLQDASSESDDILRNLYSAYTISNFSFSEDLVKRIPNVRILSVIYDDAIEGFDEGAYALNNISRLEKLEYFGCIFSGVRSIRRRNDMLSNLTFPHSLQILHIGGIQWDDVTAKIASLPLLEDLCLFLCRGTEWNHVEGQFVSLKSLELSFCCDLQCFTADTIHFPCLEQLFLWNTDCLKEISSDIGDIQTLRYIELIDCPDSAVASAKKIADYQKYEMGNEELQINVTLCKESSLSTENLRASNFKVIHARR